jgi:hypothetical protein
MNNQNIYEAVLGLVDIAVEHNTAPLVLGDIKFEMLRTGKVRPSHPIHKWVAGDAINILSDLKEYLENEFDLKEK